MKIAVRELARDLERAVRRAAVDDDDLVAPGDALEAGAMFVLLVLADDDRRDLSSYGRDVAAFCRTSQGPWGTLVDGSTGTGSIPVHMGRHLRAAWQAWKRIAEKIMHFQQLLLWTFCISSSSSRSRSA